MAHLQLLQMFELWVFLLGFVWTGVIFPFRVVMFCFPLCIPLCWTFHFILPCCCVSNLDFLPFFSSSHPCIHICILLLPTFPFIMPVLFAVYTQGRLPIIQHSCWTIFPHPSLLQLAALQSLTQLSSLCVGPSLKVFPLDYQFYLILFELQYLKSSPGSFTNIGTVSSSLVNSMSDKK